MVSLICSCQLLSFQDMCYNMNSHTGLIPRTGPKGRRDSHRETEIEYSVIGSVFGEKGRKVNTCLEKRVKRWLSGGATHTKSYLKKSPNNRGENVSTRFLFLPSKTSSARNRGILLSCWPQGLMEIHKCHRLLKRLLPRLLSALHNLVVRPMIKTTLSISPRYKSWDIKHWLAKML